MRTVPVGSLDSLLETLDLRRPAVAAHSRRVAAAALKLGVAIGLDPEELADLATAARIHDAGSLLGRPTNLLDLEEWCGLSEQVADILWYSSRPYSHHRHAPLAARILAVAHTFDDLISPREYQVPMSPETARLAIAREAGRRFCPLAANALMIVRPEVLDEDAERAVADVVPCGRAEIDPSRIEAASPWRIDYRLVTTS
jgi:response regulator RpfG family c-di-GMP phosphodiesterase